MEIVGSPPELAGLVCEAIVRQQFIYNGELVDDANVVYLCFAARWHQLIIDNGVVFWRSSPEAPKPLTAEDDSFEYPLIDVGLSAGLTGCRLESYRVEDTPSGVEVIFLFDNRRTIVIQNEGDRSMFRVA